MKRTLFGLALALAVGTTVAPALGDDYRGAYWYNKYFGDGAQPYRLRGGDQELPGGALQVRAFDQGYYNAHHLRIASDHVRVFALAREGQFDNEVALVVDAKTGEVLHVVVLPH